ncbi:MAG: DUF1641 domain-containing protein [Metallosphaera sp.]|uniref:DUF1641 domain-containing protein n=1 Tax=Metallosphaera cuprina (strain Ar-4) TaxID=1006006 RepID=F4G2E7_METCR|nr:DUF1641 domain-containing protein [Metallosphaera cuprina]AEB94995.1 conserved hypothetical protein [Metallosphaera cuprina Ar-4]
MEERGVQTFDRLISQLPEAAEVIEDLLRLLKALRKSGVLDFLIGLLENLDSTLESTVDRNANALRSLGQIYATLNGDEEIKDVTLSDILRELNDPDVKRGLMAIIKVLKVIGSASREGKPGQD